MPTSGYQFLSKGYLDTYTKTFPLRPFQMSPVVRRSVSAVSSELHWPYLMEAQPHVK